MNRQLIVTAVASAVGVAFVAALGWLDLMPESTSGRLVIVAVCVVALLVLVVTVSRRRAPTGRT